MTGPIQRLCRLLASEGFIAVSPEVYHEFEAPGCILKYDVEDTDKGNRYKVRVSLCVCVCVCARAGVLSPFSRALSLFYSQNPHTGGVPRV